MAIRNFLSDRKHRKPVSQLLRVKRKQRPKTSAAKPKKGSKIENDDSPLKTNNLPIGNQDDIAVAPVNENPLADYLAVKERKTPEKKAMLMDDSNVDVAVQGHEEGEITFTVEITVSDGARLAELAIDEIELTSQQIIDLEDNIEDGVITAKLPVEVNTNNASVYIKFVGTPNVSTPVKVKYMDDVIFDNDITISGNGEGVLNSILNL